MQNPSDAYFDSLFDETELQYACWSASVKPRTCLLLHWLAELGAVREPDAPIKHRARQFAHKRSLLGRLVDNADEQTYSRTRWLLDNDHFNFYATYLMWLRFNEYVPRRFLLPDARSKVLQWIRAQMGRPELTDSETIVEMMWRAEAMRSDWGEDFDGSRWIYDC